MFGSAIEAGDDGEGLRLRAIGTGYVAHVRREIGVERGVARPIGLVGAGTVDLSLIHI